MANPSGRDYFREFVKTGKLPEVSPEDKNQMSATEYWNVIYKNMTPHEKGTFNHNKRLEKIAKYRIKKFNYFDRKIFNFSK